MNISVSDPSSFIVQLKPIVSSSISQEIRSLRKRKGLSGKELGQLLNISQQQVSRYENGVNLISIDMLLLLLYVLDTKPFEFMSDIFAHVEKTMLSHHELSVLFSYSALFNHKLAHLLPPSTEQSLCLNETSRVFK